MFCTLLHVVVACLGDMAYYLYVAFKDPRLYLQAYMCMNSSCNQRQSQHKLIVSSLFK